MAKCERCGAAKLTEHPCLSCQSQPKGKTWCECGHHKSKHAPTPRVSGTSCLEQTCRCPRFVSAATQPQHCGGSGQIRVPVSGYCDCIMADHCQGKQGKDGNRCRLRRFGAGGEGSPGVAGPPTAEKTCPDCKPEPEVEEKRRWTIWRTVWNHPSGETPGPWSVLRPDAPAPTAPADNERVELVEVMGCDEHEALRAQWERERGELEDAFEHCDNCERPTREDDLETIWCTEAESGEQVDARICAVCRAEKKLKEVEAERDDIQAEAMERGRLLAEAEERRKEVQEERDVAELKLHDFEQALTSEEANRAVCEVLDDEAAESSGGEAVTDYALTNRVLQAAIQTAKEKGQVDAH